MGVLVNIGATLVAVGIFSFIAANWSEMTKIIKILIILISMIASYGTGWYLKQTSKESKTGDALILLGSIIYGAAIFLVAQMFNIRADWPDGFILWMIGTIAVALADEIYSLFYLAIILGFIAVVGYQFSIFGGFGQNYFLLTSSFLLLASTIITFVTGWIVYKRIPAEELTKI